jgi:V8-like Glu-specific endopeptidase
LVLAGFGLPASALALRLRTPAGAPAASLGGIPSATRSNGVPEIGALYASASATQHGCTASVVDSPRGNTLITAAHCVVGSGVGMVFAPGQRGAEMPYGRWIVTATYAPPAWLTRQAPHADIAFLTVAPRTIHGVRREIEQVTGAYELGSRAVSGQRVTVIGYPAGSTNRAITCAAKVYLTQRFPSFDCRGFVGGTSGSPWLRFTRHGTEIVGVIGGLDQGGCYDYTSYTSPLARNAHTTYHHASKDAPPDVTPQPGSDGC